MTSRVDPGYLRTYLVTDPVLCGARGVLSVIESAVAGGATTVQIRDKTAGGRELFELVCRAAELTDGKATLLVNDRVDVYSAAKAVGAAVDGVHLGQEDLPVAAVRKAIGPDAVIGLSADTHAHLDEVHALGPGTVDYLGVGAIRETSTKADHPAPLGYVGFAQVAAATTLPCVAIGGVQARDTLALREAGAAGVATVSAICAADDPRRAAREFAQAWDAAEAPSGK
ncbi:thiamine phosphate synthase [Dietzia timorensis]|uniref:Thiamine-phosphate synthase n=1 Tax=Dietzia timorensis TaxID=499555 RepID=A0A173LIX1_9ACTN|nr:thiamine phosphate synthase [Dietzia timorensis]ANI91729.1 Thiamine-phosphate synthase [Dietzia timorensis]